MYDLDEMAKAGDQAQPVNTDLDGEHFGVFTVRPNPSCNANQVWVLIRSMEAKP